MGYKFSKLQKNWISLVHAFILAKGVSGEKIEIRRWVQVVKNKKTPELKQPSELDRIKKENARLQKERELLKKWQRYLAEKHQSDLDPSRSTDDR